MLLPALRFSLMIAAAACRAAITLPPMPQPALFTQRSAIAAATPPPIMMLPLRHFVTPAPFDADVSCHVLMAVVMLVTLPRARYAAAISLLLPHAAIRC